MSTVIVSFERQDDDGKIRMVQRRFTGTELRMCSVDILQMFVAEAREDLEVTYER